MTSRKKKSTAQVLRAPPRKTSRQYARDSRPSVFWFVVKWCFILGLWGALGGVAVLAYLAADLPDITKAAKFEKQTSIIVLAADGSTLARYGETKSKSISAQDMPKNLLNAVLATEDRRFYDHPGIDILGILRAVVVNIMEGRTVQGGSTITQQLAKNLFLTHDRTLKRKIQEALLALWLEHELTKDEILTAYLNRVYLGSGVYGMDAAARLYFNKPVQDIDLREAATLAGLLKAPSRFSPLNNPALAKKRADVVLMAMADAGYITPSQAKGLANAAPKPARKPTTAGAGRYYADWVIEGLDDLIGRPATDIIIETTLLPAVQSQAETALSQTLSTEGDANHITQGAVLVMQPDGAVIAMIGGRNYALSEFNRTVQATRASGSAFKTFVFMAALENGWRASSTILDAPITDGQYKPQNFGDKYFGQSTLADALALSMNTATVRLMREVGVSPVLDVARRMGILSKLEPNLSTGLGSSGVNMLELTTAYATLANGGHRVFPYAITRIKDESGRVLYERDPPGGYMRILDSSDVAEMTMMLRGVITNGTGQNAALGAALAAGKTGTSQDSRDAWFVGYTDRAVAAVWLGNDDNSPMKKVTGGNFPAKIWSQTMTAAQSAAPPSRFEAMSWITPAAGQQEYPAPQNAPQKDDGGIGGLIGRLLSSEPEKTETPKGEYNRLNE